MKACNVMLIIKHTLRFFILMFISLILLPYNKDTCFAQSPETVINSFKKLNIRCNIGLSYRDYNRELAEVIFQHKLFSEKIETENVSSNEEAREVIRNIKIDILLTEAQSLYSFANKVWDASFEAPGRDGILYIGKPAWKDFFMLLPSVYDKIYQHPKIFELGGEKCLRLQYILSILWNDAEAKLISAETVYTEEQ